MVTLYLLFVPLGDDAAAPVKEASSGGIGVGRAPMLLMVLLLPATEMHIAYTNNWSSLTTQEKMPLMTKLTPMV